MLDGIGLARGRGIARGRLHLRAVLLVNCRKEVFAEQRFCGSADPEYAVDLVGPKKLAG
jgi:hypothetical protein